MEGMSLRLAWPAAAEARKVPSELRSHSTKAEKLDTVPVSFDAFWSRKASSFATALGAVLPFWSLTLTAGCRRGSENHLMLLKA